jgi:iron complex outermembrane recepter protein
MNTTHMGRQSRPLKHLLLGGAAALLMAQAASAQTPGATARNPAQPEDEAEVSEVVVTGTQLRGVAPVGSALTSISREDIEVSGALNTVQLLQKSPQVFNIGVSDASRGNTGGNSNITYGSGVNLRGLSPYATLVLVNGHRMVPQEQRAEVVDPQHLATNMVERVEIVADGGSAIYGADAIVGVANFILRRRFDGVEVSGRYGRSNHGLKEQAFQLTAGHVWDSGQITAGFEYTHRSAFAQSALSYDTRDQRPFGGPDIRALHCSPGTIQIGSTTYAIPEGGVTPATAHLLVPNTANRCEPFKTAHASPIQMRRSFAMTFDQDLAPWLHLYGEAYVSKRNMKLRATPPSITMVVPSTNAFYVAPAGVTVPLCSASTNATFGTPAGTRCLTVLYNFARETGIETNLYGYSMVYEGTAGLRVDLPYEWQADANFTYGMNQEPNFDRSYARVHAVNQNRALASSNPNTALNLFGGPTNPDLIRNDSPISIFNQLFDTNGHTILEVAQVKFDGPLFTLPGGEMKAAVGAEHFVMKWWSNNATGPLTAPVYATPQHVRRYHYSYFGEVLIPLVGGDFTLPFVKSLDIDIAGRVDDYNDVGVTRNPKIGVNYEPFDGLKFHASYGTSFRSPNILDIYQVASNISVSTLADPTCQCNVIALRLSGGNPGGVGPETAETYSLGFDWNPTFLPDLRLGVNFFKITISNQIAAFQSDATVLDKEAELSGTGVITRVTNQAMVDALLATKTVTSGSLPADRSLIKVIIDGRPLNLGRAYTEGFDINASYRIETERFGSGVIGMNGSLFTLYKDQALVRAPKINRLNDIFFPPKWRARYYIGWNYGDFSGTLTYNYVNPYNNTLVTPNQRVDETTTTDLYVSYSVPSQNPWTRDLKLAVNVTNLFDEDPPHVFGNGTGVLGTGNTSNFAGAGFDPTRAYILGRLISVSIDKKF